MAILQVFVPCQLSTHRLWADPHNTIQYHDVRLSQEINEKRLDYFGKGLAFYTVMVYIAYNEGE